MMHLQTHSRNSMGIRNYELRSPTKAGKMWKATICDGWHDALWRP